MNKFELWYEQEGYYIAEIYAEDGSVVGGGIGNDSYALEMEMKERIARSARAVSSWTEE